MRARQPYRILQNKQKLNVIITVCIMLVISANVTVDYLETVYRNSSFYISESLLFSSYWLLFLLLLPLLGKPGRSKKPAIQLLFISSATLAHLSAYPALVWLISKIFYPYTFDYWQTFNFGLSAYFIKTVIIYSFFSLLFTLLKKKKASYPIKNNESRELPAKNYINSILVTDSNRKLLLQLDDIFYFSANPPYITIYHSTKKYLHAATLRSLETQLDSTQFIRIHKSYIVNICKIISIQSRQNGDYDVTLSDNSTLRVSRNYAKNLKSKITNLLSLP